MQMANRGHGYTFLVGRVWHWSLWWPLTGPMEEGAGMSGQMPMEKSWEVLQFPEFWHPWLNGLPWSTR